MNAQTFFQEFQRLLDKTPKRPEQIYNSIDCIGNYIHNSKNLQYCFDCAKCTDGIYLFDSSSVDSSVDCDYAVECQLCYECVDPFKCFNCSYLEYCSNMRDSDFSIWCMNCNDVFGCVLLRNKSFCIFNRQFTEDEYRKRVAVYRTWPPEKILAEIEKLRNRFPLTQTNSAHNENSDFGDFVHYCKNCYMSFDAAYDENCAYVYDTFHCKSVIDATYEFKDDLVYQAVDSISIFNSNFIVNSKNCSDSNYIFDCANVKNSLGCVGLANVEYCILNRQFTKEEYEKKSLEIITVLKNANLDWHTLNY